MKLYLGVDLHRRSCWITVMKAEGRVLESRRLSTECSGLLAYFSLVPKPAAVAVEAPPTDFRLPLYIKCAFQTLLPKKQPPIRIAIVRLCR